MATRLTETGAPQRVPRNQPTFVAEPRASVPPAFSTASLATTTFLVPLATPSLSSTHRTQPASPTVPQSPIVSRAPSPTPFLAISFNVSAVRAATLSTHRPTPVYPFAGTEY